MTAGLAVSEQEKVGEVTQEVSSVVERARAIEVQTPEQAQIATGFLTEIAAAKRKGEKARRFLVDPLNEHVKAINERFKGPRSELEEADDLVRQKVLAYEREQEQARAQEQARLDAERRAAEEQAEAERRRKAQEAAEAESAAAEAEATRQAEIAAQKNEKRSLIASMDDRGLAALIATEGSPADEVGMAAEEVEARKRAREAQERAAQARQEAEESQQREIAAKSAPALQVAATPLASASGSASVRREWKAEVIDKAQIPNEFLIVDMKKINAVVKAGVREIPGVKIEQVAGLAVRTK